MNEVGDLQPKPNLIHKVQEKFAAAKDKSNQAKAQAKAAKQAEKEADAKLSVGERLKKKIGKIETIETEKKLPLGAQVEREWLRAYSRIYDALGEGKFKQAMEKISPLLTLHAKAARVGNGVADGVLSLLSLESALAGLKAEGGAIAAKHHGDYVSQADYSRYAGQEFSKAGFLRLLNLEKISIARARAQGWAGEKIIRVANKILHKPEKPAPPADVLKPDQAFVAEAKPVIPK